MTTIETTLFSYTELSEDAKKLVIQNKIKSAETDDMFLQYSSDSMMDSLKSITESCSLKMVDWCFGSYSRNYCVKVRNDYYEDLEGNRAIAWFLRVLIDNGYSRPKKFKDMKFNGVCGFTGMGYDEDILETIYGELLNGKTVAKAFDSVGKKLSDMLYDEYVYLTSEEGIMDHLDEKEEIYTEDGEEY